MLSGKTSSDFHIILIIEIITTYWLNLYTVENVRESNFSQEFSLANIIFHALKEQEASEQSARMNAMENATRNAGKLFVVDEMT